MMRSLASPTKRKLSVSENGESSGSSKQRSVSFNTSVDWHKDVTYAVKAGRWETLRGHLSLQQSLAGAREASTSSLESEEKGFWKLLSARAGGSNHNKSTPKDRTGLLTVDSDGRTPLHVALTSRRTPKDILLLMIQLEPKAVAVKNHRQRYPLHFAVVHRHHMDVIAELVDTYPAALASADSKGMSPLAYALDGARRETNLSEAPRTFWMPAVDDSPEAKWQEAQGERWGIVHWLLLSSATHPQTSLSVGGKKPMLVDALIHAAPPAVISLLIGASVMLLSHENRATAFAGSTLYSCIARHYPLTILMSLVSQCPPDVHQVRDETGMGLLSSQYISGCFEQVKSTQEWTLARGLYDTLIEAMEDECLPHEDPPFLDWWQKMEFLLAFCAGQNRLPSKPLLLHAALRNVDTPPAIVRLLLALHPESMAIVDSTGAFPLFLAAGRPEYVPRYYEPPTDSTILEIVLSYDKRAISRRHAQNQRLPLHAAVLAGRPFSQIRPLVSSAAVLLQADPVTKLYPVLQAACVQPNSFRSTCLARNQYSYSVWKNMSDREKAGAVLKVSEKEGLEGLTTVYELLRWQPNILEKLVEQTREKVSHHYLEFCYTKELQPHIRHWQQLEQALLSPSTQWHDGLESEFKAWWNKTKFWIRYCCPDGIPAYDDDYLLHAALANPDTPPVVIQLLVAHDPAAVMRPLPDSPSILPLHLAAAAVEYVHHPWEVEGPSAVEVVCAAYPAAAHVRNEHGHWPWFLALRSGKSGQSLFCLMEQPQRFQGLYPFQWMATARSYSASERLRFQKIARRRLGNASPKQVRAVQKEHQLTVLSMVFEMLRRRPGLLHDSEETLLGDHLERRMSSSSSSLPDDTTREGDDLIAIVSDEDSSSEDDPSPLSRLLSTHSKPPQPINEEYGGDDMFECDASVLSGVDVLSTLSSTFHTYDNKQGGAQRGVVRMASYQRRVEEEESSSSDEDFNEEASIGLEDMTDFSTSVAEFAEDSQTMELCRTSISSAESQPEQQQQQNMLGGSDVEHTEEEDSISFFDYDDEDDIFFLIRRQPLIKTKTQRDPLSNVKLSKKPATNSNSAAEMTSPTYAHPLKPTVGAEAHKLLQSSMHSSTRSASSRKLDSAHSKKSTHSSTDGSYESLKPEEKRKINEQKSMMWVSNQVYKKTLLGADSISADADEMLMESFALGSQHTTGASSSHGSSTTDNTGVGATKEGASPAKRLLTNGTTLERAGSVPPPRQSMVPGIAAYLRNSSSNLALDDPTVSSNAPSTLSYLQDGSSRDNSSVSASVKDSSSVSGDERKNAGVGSGSPKSPKLSVNVADNSETNVAAIEPKDKSHDIKETGNDTRTTMSFDPVSMKWKRQTHENKSLEVGTKSSKSSTTSAVDEANNIYFDKKAMRWRTRTPPEETSKAAKSSRSVSDEDTEASMSRERVTRVAMPFVDILTRDDIRRRNRRFSNASTGMNPPKTPSDREFRSTWRQMFDATEKSLCCLLCHENSREVLMVPCRHLAICRKCSAKQVNVSTCPLCHKPSTDRMLLF